MKTRSPNKSDLLVAGALLGLLASTIAAAYVDLGPFNLAVSLGISIAKALLILYFFMNLRGSSRLIWFAAAAGFFWFAIMVALAMSDFAMRG